jgi:hypothetical protein
MSITATPGSVFAIHTYQGWVGVVGVTYCKKTRKTSKKALKDATKLREKMLARAEEAKP